MTRRVKEPHADCCDEHQHNHHTEQHSGDIGSTELSDAWHTGMIIVTNKASRAAIGRNLTSNYRIHTSSSPFAKGGIHQSLHTGAWRIVRSGDQRPG